MLLLHELPSGAQVRLRLPVRADGPCLRDLAGAERAERLLRFDPRRQAVICAAAWTGGVEEVVGVGAIELGAGTEPELVVADGHGPELEGLLARALVTRARNARHQAPRRARVLRGIVPRARRP